MKILNKMAFFFSKCQMSNVCKQNEKRKENEHYFMSLQKDCHHQHDYNQPKRKTSNNIGHT